MRRSSNSSSQLSRPSDLGGLPVKPASPAPAVHTDVPFPTSPTPSNSSVTSSATFDSLKSSLRDTLQIDGQSRGTGSSRPRHSKRRSVSFAVQEPQTGPATTIEAASSAAGESDSTAAPEASGSTPARKRHPSNDIHVVDFISSGTVSSSSPSSAASSPLTSTFPSPVAKRLVYPVKHWEPISPETGEITSEERAKLPSRLDLARSIFVGVMDEPPDGQRKDTFGSSRLTRRDRKDISPVPIERGVLKMTFQTLVGLWLAIVWLIVARLLGPSKRGARSHQSS